MLLSSGLVVGAWAYLDRHRKHLDDLADVWRGQSVIRHVGALYRDDGADQDAEGAVLWVTALPMLFVGAITLIGSYEMFSMFVGKASTMTGSGRPLPCIWMRARGIVALLAVIVLGDSMRQWYGYVVLKRPFTSSEVVVTAGGSSAGDADDHS